MDFRRVEPRFRSWALFVQVVLLAAVVAYVVYLVADVVTQDEEPPTSITWNEWKVGAGKWAICSAPNGGLVEVGMGLGTNKTGLPASAEQAGWPLSATVLEISGHQRNCSIVDLSEWGLPLQMPSGFNLCCGGTFPCGVYVWSMDQWRFFWELGPNRIQYTTMSMMTRTAQNGSLMMKTDIISGQYISDWETQPKYKPLHCPFLSPLTSSEPGYAILRMKIDSSYTMNVNVLSIQRRLWDIFGKVGGYLTIVTLLFNMCFVKKFPDSGVAQIYEERTFVAERISRSQSQANEARTLHSASVPPGMYGRE